MTEEQQSNTPKGDNYDIFEYQDWGEAQLELAIWKLSHSTEDNDLKKKERLEWELRNRSELQSQKNIRMFIRTYNY